MGEMVVCPLTFKFSLVLQDPKFPLFCPSRNNFKGYLLIPFQCLLPRNIEFAYTHLFFFLDCSGTLELFLSIFILSVSFLFPGVILVPLGPLTLLFSHMHFTSCLGPTLLSLKSWDECLRNISTRN